MTQTHQALSMRTEQHALEQHREVERMDHREARLNKLVSQQLVVMKRMLRKLGVSEDEADDISQRALILVADRLDEIKVGAEKAFLLNSARRMASHARRRAARSREREAPDEEAPSPIDSPEDLVQRKSARELFDRLLSEMPEELGEVLRLHQVEQLRVPEIAARLDAPIGTVASRLRRARKALDDGLRRTKAAASNRRRRAYFRAAGN